MYKLNREFAEFKVETINSFRRSKEDMTELKSDVKILKSDVNELKNKLNNRDELVVASEEERTQEQNRALAISRLKTFVGKALLVPRKRLSTRPTKASKLRRLESKKRRSQIKAYRRSLG